MPTCCQGVNQGGQTSCSAVGFSVKLKREMSNIVCIAFKLVCYLLVFIKCLKSSHLLSNLCHHNAFSLYDVFVNQVDIGNSLWVQVLAVIVANKQLPSVVRMVALPESIVVTVDETTVADENICPTSYHLSPCTSQLSIQTLKLWISLHGYRKSRKALNKHHKHRIIHWLTIWNTSSIINSWYLFCEKNSSKWSYKCTED